MTTLSRRAFLQYCGISAAALGLDPLQLDLLGKALANPSGPSVIWLHGSSCTGCSVSLLNRISDRVGEPATIVDVLAGSINLVYHATLMASAGDPAVAAMRRLYNQGGYVLVCEGGVPTMFGGHCCKSYVFAGREVTFMEAVQEYSAKAEAIVCVGTCASFGGIPHSGSNPTGIVSVGELTGRPTINISGCPANPDWTVWAIVQLILGNSPVLDADGRPVALYNTLADGVTPAAADEIHNKPCPRNLDSLGGATVFAEAFGEADLNTKCLRHLGCRGPNTKARCDRCWNGIAESTDPVKCGTSCIAVNAPCHGCVERTFPGPESFYNAYTPPV